MKENALKYLLATLSNEKADDYVDFMLPGYLAEPIVAYGGMRSDLLYVIEMAKILLNSSLNETLRVSLWSSIVINYGRCFTNATSNNFPKLEPKDCFADDTKRFLELHNELMTLRHHYVAHRGENEYEAAFGYMRFFTKTGKTSVNIKQLKRNRPEYSQIREFISLFEYLIVVIENKFAKAGERAIKNLFKSFTVDEILALRV
jgi:hypothetical protein